MYFPSWFVSSAPLESVFLNLRIDKHLVALKKNKIQTFAESTIK